MPNTLQYPHSGAPLYPPPPSGYQLPPPQAHHPQLHPQQYLQQYGPPQAQHPPFHNPHPHASAHQQHPAAAYPHPLIPGHPYPPLRPHVHAVHNPLPPPVSTFGPAQPLVPPPLRQPNPPPSLPTPMRRERYWAIQLNKFAQKAESFWLSHEDVFILDTILLALHQVQDHLNCDIIETSGLDYAVAHFVAISKASDLAEAQGLVDSSANAGLLLETWWPRFGGSAAASLLDIMQATLRAVPPGMRNGAKRHVGTDATPVVTAGATVAPPSSALAEQSRSSGGPAEGHRNDDHAARDRENKSALSNPGSTSTSTSALPATPADGHPITLHDVDLGGEEPVPAKEGDSSRREGEIQTERRQTNVDNDARLTAGPSSKITAGFAAVLDQNTPKSKGIAVKPKKNSQKKVAADKPSASESSPSRGTRGTAPAAAASTPSSSPGRRGLRSSTQSSAEVKEVVGDAARELQKLAVAVDWRKFTINEINNFKNAVNAAETVRKHVSFNDVFNSKLLKDLKTIGEKKDHPLWAADLIGRAHRLHVVWVKRFESELQSQLPRRATSNPTVGGRPEGSGAVSGISPLGKRKRIDGTVAALTRDDILKFENLLIPVLKAKTRHRPDDVTVAQIDTYLTRLEKHTAGNSLKLVQNTNLEQKLELLADMEMEEDMVTEFDFANRARRLMEDWDNERGKQ